MSQSLDSILRSRLAARQRRGRLRTRTASHPLSPTEIEWNEEILTNFGSNDYLALASKRVPASPNDQPTRTGSGASPLLSGYTLPLAELENTLAKFKHADAALVFSSGYAANVGTLSSLIDKHDLILADRLCHASMIDGFRLSGATTRFVQHNSVDDFRLQLTTHRHPGQTVWIATESVFSMDGDLAPLAPLADLCDENECRLIVDEAHATGVYGSRGNGLVDELGLAERVPVRIGTLSKAIGSHGGFAVGSQPLIDWLVNSARSYMYSTALPPLVHIASRHRITQIETMDVERTRLRRTAAHFRQQLVKHGFTTMPGDSPIIPVIIGSDEAVVRISTQLRGAGFYVPAIRPPTVPKDAAMLRISLNLAHTDDQRNALLTALTLTA